MSTQYGEQQTAASSITFTHNNYETIEAPAMTKQPARPSLDGDENPLNWSRTRKWALTLMVSSTFLNCTLASSMANAASKFYVEGFGASQEVAALILSFYMLGFALGPLLWAPLSESLGRKVAMAIAMPCFALINVGCALSNDMATLLVLRVFAGFFGGCPQSTAGATIADVWSPAQRAWPMLVYTFCAFGGPVIGPMAGGFLYVSGNWRWIYWLLTIFGFVNSAIVVLFQRETYAPLLLKRKLKAAVPGSANTVVLTESTPHEPGKGLRAKLFRPFSLLFDLSELPLLYAAVWTGWSYALLFIFFEAYPVIYGGIYGFNAGESGLCFLGFGIGIALSIPIISAFQRHTQKQLGASGGVLVPESRLAMVSFTAPMYIVGFLWFGWAARNHVHWIVSVIGTIPIGTAVILSFNALTVYVSQCYHVYAASALGSMAFSRCLLAVFMPLFGRQMYQGLGPGWASTILAFISLVMVPVPFVFMRYGTQIRQISKVATSLSRTRSPTLQVPAELEKRRESGA